MQHVHAGRDGYMTILLWHRRDPLPGSDHRKISGCDGEGPGGNFKLVNFYQPPGRRLMDLIDQPVSMSFCTYCMADRLPGGCGEGSLLQLLALHGPLSGASVGFDWTSPGRRASLGPTGSVRACLGGG